MRIDLEERRFVVGELWAWARGIRRRIRVSGPSMEPTLHDADQILIDPQVGDRPNAGRSISVGAIVVFHHPDPARATVLVKRVETILGSGALVVTSDNRCVGTDSRTFGPIQPETVLGVATLDLARFRRLR